MCKTCDAFNCPKDQNTCNDGERIVAFCIRKNELGNDYCDRSLLRKIYEYPENCFPTNCPVQIKNHCSPNPCKNLGKCTNFPGSYFCTCESGYHGRDCSLTGGDSRLKVFFIYDPIAGWKPNQSSIQQQVTRSKGLIFLSDFEDNTVIKFTASCSVKTRFAVSKEKEQKGMLARDTCETAFRENENVKKNFCKYLPRDEMSYFELYFDNPFDNTNEPPGSVKMSYNRETDSEAAGFKISKVTLSITSGKVEKYQESFDQVIVLQSASASECQTPVNLVVSGMRCVTPLKRKINAKISIKSVFETQPKFDSGLVCNYLYPTYHWEVFQYDKLVLEPTAKRDKTLPSQNCSEFDSSDHNCHEHFEIKPYSLEVGIYQIKLTVNAVLKKTFKEHKSEPIPIEMFGLYFIKIEQSPLVAVIEGGASRTVSMKDTHIIIDGSHSHDPNLPPDRQNHLQWAWSCKGFTGKCCKDITGKVCHVVERLKENQVYEFTLKLETKNGLKAQASQNLSVSSIPQLQLEIRCLKNCGLDGFQTNPKEMVYMEAKVISNSVKVAELTFVWKYSCVSGTIMESADDIKQNNVESHILIIKEDKLTPGAECKFTVNLKPKDGVEGGSSITIQIGKLIGMGECKITPDCEPDNCVKAKAKFTVTCSNFTHYIETAQLIYSFYQNEGQVSPGTLLGFSMSGELNDLILTDNSITVRVSDQFGTFVDYKAQIPVKLKDWNPNEQELDKMLNRLDTFVLSRDSSSSAMIAGAIIDVMGNTSNRPQLLEKVITSLTKQKQLASKRKQHDYVNDLSDVKLYASTMKKIVSKGIRESKTQVGSKIVESLGMLIMQLSSQLLLDVRNDNKEFPAISDDDIKEITLTMVESAAIISSSENIKTLDVTTGTLAVFAKTNQYKRGTASMIGGLVLSGMAILNSLLPHQEEVVVSSENTTMWTKVESPVILANTSGIPKNSSTKIKMSKAFGKKLQSESENVALQVIIFNNNPYWWDIEDRDVASEIISVSTWRNPETGLSSINDKLITDISDDLDIYLKFKTIQSESLSGSVTAAGEFAMEDEKDESVAVHTLEAPPENSNGKLFVEFENLENTEFRVLLTENIRPDYRMMDKAKIVSAKEPLISFTYNNITADTLHFIGILPHKQESPGRTVKYKFNIYSIQCKIRHQTVWTSPSCKVGEETTKDVVHCRCSHMSFFGSSIFIAPNLVHPIEDVELLLTAKDNFLAVIVIVTMISAYIILLVWAIYMDKHDIIKRKVITLEDNFPGETHMYLVVVHTSSNYGSGTNANVGITLFGSDGRSRPHILRSKGRVVLQRSSDDWFIIYTQKSLGTLRMIHMWHDNSGRHPDWYCQKVVVYDVPEGSYYTFIVDQWLSVWPGEYTEVTVYPAGVKEVIQWKRVVTHNIMYNLRENHLLLGIYMSHPRATVSKSQRVTIFFCVILTNLLTGVMFYEVARGGVETDDPQFKLKLRVFIVALESAIISALATLPVVFCFRKSQRITVDNDIKRSGSSISDVESFTALTKEVNLKGACFKHFMKKMVRGKPLIPVVIGKDSAESLIIKRNWARCGWAISQVVIFGGGYLTILYGLKMGKVESELWITSAVSSVTWNVFINSPIKIMIISTILSMFGEIYNVTTYEYESQESVRVALIGNEKYLNNLLKLRASAIYKPMSYQKIEESRKRVLKRMRFIDRVEFFASVFLFLIVMNLSGDLWQGKSFYISSHIALSLSVSHGPLAVPLDDVTNVKKLTDYLISKLFRALYKGRWYNKRVNLTSTEESSSEKGWFDDNVHRMVGIPRMRQLRIKADNCSWVGLLNVSNAVCGFSLRPSTEDIGDYGFRWRQINADINRPILSPWTYQKIGQGDSVYGVSGIKYHTGGYVVDLNDTQNLCNIRIADLIDLAWWDVRMRASIIELSLYNPNTDTHSFVSIVTEHLPSGAFTNIAHVISVHLEPNLFWILLYSIGLVFFNTNLFLVINRRGMATTMSCFWGCYDVVFVGLLDAAVIFHIFKTTRALTSLDIFQEAGSSGFFYFSDIVWYQKTAQIVWSLVLCVAPFRLLKFQPLVFTCKAACYTLFKIRKLLFAVSIIIIMFTIFLLFVINFKIIPGNSPFEADMIFYTTPVRETFDTTSRHLQFLTSLLLATVFSVSILVLQMIIINVYKVVSNV